MFYVYHSVRHGHLSFSSECDETYHSGFVCSDLSQCYAATPWQNPITAYYSFIDLEKMKG